MTVRRRACRNVHHGGGWSRREMAWSPDDPLLWGGVFLLVFLVEVVIVLNLKAQRSKVRYEPQTREAQLHEGEELTDVLSRFVDDEKGERVGETVGMDGDKVIVKSKDKASYYAVPRASLEEMEGDFKVRPGVDWKTAEEEGEAWKKRQHRLVEYTQDELPEDERPGDR
jgi:hypothetical protein